MKNPTIISLGGSLIVPDTIDTVFLSQFKKLLETEIEKGREFVVVLGGGKTARRYQAAGKEVASLTPDDVDWLGIYSIQLNAELVRIIFGTLAHERVVIKPSDIPSVKKPLAVAGAEEPGHSSDFDAVEMALQANAKTIINMSNIDYVYEKDPRVFPEAKKVEKASWPEFRKILPPVEAWEPGSNTPFDPVAAKRAEELGLEVVIMNGKPLDNLRNYLEGKSFKGTVISR